MKKLTAQQQILEDFARTWKEHTGNEYYINWGKDVKFANELIAMNLKPDEYQARKRIFFSDRKWWEYGNWGFATFVNNINKCIPEPKKEPPKRAMKIQQAGDVLSEMKFKCAEHGIEHGAFQQCPDCAAESKKILEGK